MQLDIGIKCANCITIFQNIFVFLNILLTVITRKFLFYNISNYSNHPSLKWKIFAISLIPISVLPEPKRLSTMYSSTDFWIPIQLNIFSVNCHFLQMQCFSFRFYISLCINKTTPRSNKREVASVFQRQFV